uniref:Syndecan n=1 Tax=Trichuris muris TaxID=70415 RepID=A0A5S6QXV0_TRIMR
MTSGLAGSPRYDLLLATFLTFAICAAALADSGVAVGQAKSTRDFQEDWEAASSVHTIDRGFEHDIDFDEGSGKTGASDIEDTASGYGPDDEDSEFASGSHVDPASSGYDGHDFEYPKEVWSPGVTTARSPDERTTEAVPDVNWQPTAQTEWPKFKESSTVVTIGQSVDEGSWATLPTSPLTPRSTTTIVPSVTRPTNVFGPRKSGSFDSFLRPGILAAVIGGSVVGLLVAILLITLVVYRMRKKDEGSYALDESKTPPAYPYAYHKAPTREFYA